MRIAVISDSHGDFYNANKALKEQASAEAVFCLGDGKNEYSALKELYRDKMFLIVKGNCDYICDNPETEIISIAGKKIIAVHGHTIGVKSGLERLSCYAMQEKADIVLFGHTHIPFTDYVNGIYFLNPGTVKGLNGTYATIDITPQGVLLNIVPVNRQKFS